MGVARFEAMEKLARVALRKAGFLRSPSRGPLTRSRSQHASASVDTLSQRPPSRASSFGLPSELERDVDTDSLRTADDILSQPDSDAPNTSEDEEEIPQVVINFKQNANQEYASATEDMNENYADNEASETEHSNFKTN